MSKQQRCFQCKDPLDARGMKNGAGFCISCLSKYSVEVLEEELKGESENGNTGKEDISRYTV